MSSQAIDTVVTPVDDQAAYAPDWRARLACIMFEHGKKNTAKQHQKYWNDNFVRLYFSYLTSDNARQLSYAGFAALRRVLRWRGGSDANTAARLDALLLTEAPLSVIAAHIDGPGADTAPFECYERLFFNCRGPAFEPCASDALKTAFANVPVEFTEALKAPAATEWRAVAANFGYEALVAMFRWATPTQSAASAESIRKAVVSAMQSNMIPRVAMRRVDDFNAAQWVKADAEITAAKIKAEAGATGAVEIAKIIQTLLGYTAPKPLLHVGGADMDAAIAKRLQATDEETPGARVDAAGGSKALDALIDKAFGKG